MPDDARAALKDIRRAAAFLRSRAPAGGVDTALILGSGLGGAIPELQGARSVPYEAIPAFPRATVPGHGGRLHLGVLRAAGRRRRLAVLQGRFHFYEGHSMGAVMLPLRALRELGLRSVLITSAVGSLRPSFRPGHVVVIKDHINFMGSNPLRGFHQEQFGQMFPDLVDAYTPRLRRLALRLGRGLRLPIGEGTYVATPGPSYETPAEIRAFRLLGADVVGMSVVPEAIAARQMGLEVLALSWVANMAAGISKEALKHGDVLALGRVVAGRLRGLLTALLKSGI